MTVNAEFDSRILAAELANLETVVGAPLRYVVAFSGGLDSTALLNALSELRQSGRTDAEISAIHVDHGLQKESVDWARHCEANAKQLAIDFQTLIVNVATDSGSGPEAAARDARYRALEPHIKRGDWLLSAHHRDDQAETLLLNLMRGSGPAGLAGIGEIRRFGGGWLARPMLNARRSAIMQYANDAGLKWIDDPSNSDRRFDRNFLRHELLPILESRWPDAATRLRRSAVHAGDAAQLLQELADLDLLQLGGRADRLPVDQIAALTPGRQRNLIRGALRRLGLPMPSTAQLQRVVDEVIPAREDAQPLVAWPGVTVRRYRNRLYLLPDSLMDVLQTAPIHNGLADLGANLGALRLVHGASTGVSEHLVERGLSVSARVGGEEFRPVGQSHTRKLKKLLQEEGIVPWMRDRLPLVYCEEQLVAVGDLWLSADAASHPGVAVEWSRRPALH